MKVAFDTSVLVAASVASHRHFSRAIVWLEAAHEGKLQAVVSVHALAEIWSVLTKLPIHPPVSTSAAREAVRTIADRFEVIPASNSLYAAALDRCAAKNLRSGAIFDALHLISGEAAGADVMLTFNRDDFAKLSVARSPELVVPTDPPSADV